MRWLAACTLLVQVDKTTRPKKLRPVGTKAKGEEEVPGRVEGAEAGKGMPRAYRNQRAACDRLVFEPEILYVCW